MVVYVLVLLSALLAVGEAREFNGRATFYQDNTQGSCRYGAPPDIYYAAWPDKQDGFPNCGKCFELQCVNKQFHDGYGQPVDRGSACYDENKKVVVKIIDSCPCVHANYYSNQRWCCGDMEHIDISQDVFKMLADEHWGVIGLKWRETSCDKLGEVTDNGGSDDNKSSDNAQDEDLKDFENFDTNWIKDKVRSFKGLDDQSFEQRFKDAVDGTWASRLESKTPEWAKNVFGGWRH